MIKFNDRFEFKYDSATNSWTLYELKPGKTRNGAPRTARYPTYHSSLSQVCQAIMNKVAGDCETLEEIQAAIEQTRDEFANHAELWAGWRGCCE